MRGQRRGATLIEVLLASVITVITIMTLALVFPSMSRARLLAHQRQIAADLANSQMETIKQNPYDYIPDTPAAPGGYFLTPVGNGGSGCDCGKANLVAHAQDFISTSTVLNGTAYTLMTCVNEVSGAPGAWVAQCPDASNRNQQNYKEIRVSVAWNVAGSTTPLSVDQESFVSRF